MQPSHSTHTTTYCEEKLRFPTNDFKETAAYQGNDTRSRAERLCAQAGFSPHIRLQLDQQLAAYNLAGYGLGAAFISDTLALSAPPDERLFFYRIDSPHVERSIRLFYKRTRVLTASMRALLDMLAKPDRRDAEERSHR